MSSSRLSDFPHHSIRFDQTRIIDTSVGILRSLRQIIETKKITSGELVLIEMKRNID